MRTISTVFKLANLSTINGEIIQRKHYHSYAISKSHNKNNKTIPVTDPSIMVSSGLYFFSC
ncbi:hypothetical protein MOSE0_N03466 [Monosporozyma servazzii]